MTPEEYRTKAADIRKRAHQIQDPASLKELMTLVQQYEQLADLLEKQGR